MRRFSVAIVGGGASGALTAAVLTKRSPAVDVAIIEPREQLGRGVAYSTDCPAHVLNVPAQKMSAFPMQPDHFVRWLAANGKPYGPSSFVPRSVYGDYLGTIDAQAQAAAPQRRHHVKAIALDAREDRDGFRIACSNGETICAGSLVLASGNSAPAAWGRVGPDVEQSGRFYRSAWDCNATVPSDPNETVVLLGMGLTAVDAVFGLRYHGHRGTIHMVSRRGLLPHEHRVFDVPPSASPQPGTVCELLDAIRTLVVEQPAPRRNWRGVVDDVRPGANALWKALSIDEQRRFFRHALPFWNVHRHRIAPESSREIAELIASRSVRVLAGRTGEITANGGTLSVPIGLRGSSDVVTIQADRVINCSGPQNDFRKLSNPLIRSLLAQGLMVPNVLGIGVRIAENGALVAADGAASTRLFAIGPARFGTLIETTAMPEIRVQVQELCELLCAASRPQVEQLAG